MKTNYKIGNLIIDNYRKCLLSIIIKNKLYKFDEIRLL